MTFKIVDMVTGRPIEIKHGETLGRTQAHHNFPETRNISRKHCQFFIEGSQVFVVDLNSRNGTFVDSVRCVPEQRTPVRFGQILEIGEKKFYAEQAAEMARQGSHRHVTNTQIISPPSQNKKVQEGKYDFNFQASTGELFKLILTNAFLSLLTFGLYTPYARKKMRVFLWKSTSLNKHPFAFKAQAKGMMKSYFIMFCFFMILGVAQNVLSVMLANSMPALMLIQAVFAVGIITLILKIRFGAYAYIVNNTSYRSVFFRMNKAAAGAQFWASIKGTLLCMCTLGFYTPFMLTRLETIKWNNTQYGSLPLSYKPNDKEFAMLWYKGFFLTVITAGLYYPWFAMAQHHYKMKHLRFGTARFQSSATGTTFMFLQLRSWAFIMFSFGLAAPYVFNLNLKYLLSSLSMTGSIDFDQIVQTSNSTKGQYQDALADLMDVDLDVA